MPNLSVEVQRLVEFIGATGVPHRVTATLGRFVSPSNPCDPHSPGSNHCRAGTGGQGLAIDLAGPSTGSVASELLPIFAAFSVVESSLAELIYSGAPYSIKNGKRVPKYAVAQHWNHVHVAVPLGTFLPVPQSPQEPGVIMEPIKIVAAFPFQDGYVFVTEDGAVYCFGCEFKGGLKWNGTAWVLR